MMPDPFPYSPDHVEDYAQGDFTKPASTARQNREFVVKSRSSSGCLIVRKKGNDGAGGLGSSDSRNYQEKKRARMNMSDSGSSNELLMPPRRRGASETVQVCNVLSHSDQDAAQEDDIGRKRIRNNDTDVTDRARKQFSERKRNRVDLFEFDEDGSDEEMRRKPFDDGRMERKRYFSPMTVGTSGLQMEYETGSSRHPLIDKRGSLYLERKGVNCGDYSGRHRTRPPLPIYGGQYDSEGNIRVQGKSGVLKVFVNKKKKPSGSLGAYDSMEVEERRKGLSSEDTIKRNNLIHPSFHAESKIPKEVGSSVSKPKNLKKLKSSSKSQRLFVRNGTIKDQDSEDSGTSLKMGPLSVENLNTRKTPLSTWSSKGQELHSEDSDTSLKLERKNAEARKVTKQASKSGEIVPRNELTARSKEGKVKRGTGTEKQKLREQIRGMLLNAGWTIDYRPRRNRDYLDAVYINPSGTAYWSIIKAYEALQKQLNDDAEEARAKGDDSFRPLPDEVLGQLTRKTRKKMEKEMKKKQRNAYESEKARDTAARRPSCSRHDEESLDSGSQEEKLSPYIKQSGIAKSAKSRMKGDSSPNPNMKGQSSTHRPDASMDPSGVDSHQGKKSRKLGRCTLLVRNSSEGLNSDSDGYVPYTGKRTVLSWLIDRGVVQLSQKVGYMNRKRTKVMLEGWITRDGIHCGCCSKILSVLKFEIHAGSKQRHPFQNICLDSGVSLLDCQIDAWNRQESVDSFHSVDVHGDSNDDACGLCGDGGDLICCDNCPSTFHQSCLGIEMLPPGDWHCPHCTCKFCGLASESIIQGDEATTSGLLTCSLCAKKYHQTCSQGVHTLSNDTDGSTPCFCGRTCKEVFEHLQKYLGVKHELESGFSWCLIRRTNVDSDIYPPGVPQRVECNSKLAVALSVMDECFLPIVDRRSGINILHNVLYNCGSNFSRLNYNSFYTAILERGDEIVSTASIRFHGTHLAEMPFIGTRYVYRRQGMCRQLFYAIESVLRLMKVQKIIIPAVPELTHTWTGVFGFTKVDKSLKQELRSVNMLVFPGIDLLQKQLLGQENSDENRTIAAGTEFKDNQCITPEPATRSDIDSSTKNDPDECDDGDVEHATRANGEVSTRNTNPNCLDVPFNKTTLRSGSLDSSDENKNLTPLDETVNNDLDRAVLGNSCTVDKMDDISESSSAENHGHLEPSHGNEISMPLDTDLDPQEIQNSCPADKMDDISESSPPAENKSDSLDTLHEKSNSAPHEETFNTGFNSAEIKSADTADPMEDTSGSSSSEEDADSFIQDDVSPINGTLVMNGSFDSYNEPKNELSIKRTVACDDIESESNVAELTSDSKTINGANLGVDRQEENEQEAFSPAKENENPVEFPSDEFKMSNSIAETGAASSTKRADETEITRNSAHKSSIYPNFDQ